MDGVGTAPAKIQRNEIYMGYLYKLAYTNYLMCRKIRKFVR